MSEYREALQRLVDATADTLREHSDATGCCWVTRSRLNEAKALLARGEPDTNLLYAAATADWGQVACNGGPPCFHLDGARFCLRAERWAGHDANGRMHRFISLAELVGESAEPAAAEKAREQLSIALGMLADWCVAVDENGTGWDDWDEHYKDAMYRPGPLREALDAEILEARKRRGLPSPPAATGETN